MFSTTVSQPALNCQPTWSALAGATVDIDQAIAQSAQFGAFNEPVDITAPETVN